VRKLFVLSLLLFVLLAFSVQITILHMNDTHGHAWAFNEWHNPNIGGFAAIVTLAKEIRQEVESQGGHVLLLHAGDVNTGVPESDLLDAVPDITALNMMNIDVMTLGNHEFDNPRDVLEMQMKLAEFPFLSANILTKEIWYEEYTAQKGDTLWKIWKEKGKGITWDKFVEKFKEFNKTDDLTIKADFTYKIPVYKGRKPFAKPYIIKDFGDVKVAIIGLTTEETKILEPVYVGDLEFIDAAEAAQKYIDELRNKVDLIVLLTHLGWGKPSGDYNTSFTLAEKIKCKKAVIIDGHSHDLGMETINGITIVQAGCYTKWLGRLDLEVADGKVTVKGWKAYPINLKKYNNETKEYSYEWKEIKPDPMVEKALAGFKVLGGRKLDVVIGVTKILLDGEREHIRSRSTNLGNLVADAMRWKARADVALTNGGGIRASLKPGPITRRDLLTVHPFGNTVYIMKLTGKQIMEVLNYAATIQPGKGAWPQISGMTVKVKDGKVVDVKINGEPLDPNKTYLFATNSYLAGGGDGYTMLKEWSASGYGYDTSYTLADAIADYIRDALGGVIESYDDSPRYQVLK
jgi:5'-nucleotidase/UDP-sugar diphosphatase